MRVALVLLLSFLCVCVVAVPVEAEDAQDLQKLYAAVAEFPGLNASIGFTGGPEPVVVGLRSFRNGKFEYVFLTDDLELKRGEAFTSSVREIDLGPKAMALSLPKIGAVLRWYNVVPQEDPKEIVNFLRTLTEFLAKTPCMRQFIGALEAEPGAGMRQRNNRVTRKLSRQFHQYLIFVANPELYDRFEIALKALPDTAEREMHRKIGEVMKARADELRSHADELGVTGFAGSGQQSEWDPGRYFEGLFNDRPMQPERPVPGDRPRGSDRLDTPIR